MFLIVLTIAVGVTIYFLFVKPFRFWSNKEVAQLNLFTLWSEIVKGILQTVSPAETIRKLYQAFPEARYSGMYQLSNPVLFIKDPELIKQIAVKDFDHFIDHKQVLPEDLEPLWAKNLLSLKGERWKDMRATLSPSFTSSKMKAMFHLMSECAENFCCYFQNSDTVTVELKDAFTRYANDIIASVAFGVPCDSLVDRNNEFYVMGKKATNFSGFLRNISVLMMVITPRLANFLGLRLFSNKVSAFFRKLVKENIESREKNGIVRPDMIQLLIQARNGRLKHEKDNSEVADSGYAVIEESALGKEEKRQKRQLTDDDLTAQVLIFFFAGFDTVSTLMCFVCYELAVDPLVQKKLQDEIDNVLIEDKGTLSYNALVKMEYFDMIISETLRKWPSLIIIDRVCTKPYVIQPEKQGEKPVYIKKGDMVWFPVFGIHRDDKFYSDPDRFDPERFSRANKTSITPYSYMPFGAGPRSCIGTRFALLETKILIFYILKNFDLVVVDKSVVPIKISRTQFSLTSENGFWFGFKPRTVVK